jgi:hypothetical protein
MFICKNRKIIKSSYFYLQTATANCRVKVTQQYLFQSTLQKLRGKTQLGNKWKLKKPQPLTVQYQLSAVQAAVWIYYWTSICLISKPMVMNYDKMLENTIGVEEKKLPTRLQITIKLKMT